MATATPATTNAHPSYQYVEVSVDPKALIHEATSEWKWLMAAGVITSVAGALAILAPVVATAFVAMFIAAMLLVVGCVNIAGLFYAQKSLKLEYFLTGVVQVLLAAVMAFYPLASLVSLTIVAAVFLMVEGVIRTGWATFNRDTPGWGWMLAGGLATIAVSVLVIFGLPGSALWVIGLLVGVSMLTGGAAQMAIAWEARKIAQATAE